MTTPTDDENEGTIQGMALYTERHDALLRKVIQKKLARLGPEEGRAWLERMLMKLTQTVIIPRSKDEGDGEKG